MTRYHSPEIVFDMTMDMGIEMIVKAMEERNKDRLWSMWIARYQHMNKDNFVSFEDFCMKASAPPVTNRTEAEIMDDVELIQHSLRGEMNGNL